jgi:hypothetical protein
MSSCAADREDAIPPRLRTRTLAVNRACRPSAICDLLFAIRRIRCHRPAVSAKPVPLSQV